MRKLSAFLFILFLFSNKALAGFRMGLGAGTQNLSYHGFVYPIQSVGLDFTYKTAPVFFIDYENLVRNGWGISLGVVYRSTAALDKARVDLAGTVVQIPTTADDSHIQVTEPRFGFGYGGKWLYCMAGLSLPRTKFTPATTFQGQLSTSEGPSRFIVVGLSVGDEFSLELLSDTSSLTMTTTQQGITQNQNFIFSRTALFLTIRL